MVTIPFDLGSAKEKAVTVLGKTKILSRTLVLELDPITDSALELVIWAELDNVRQGWDTLVGRWVCRAAW